MSSRIYHWQILHKPDGPVGAFAGNPFVLSGTRTGVDIVLVETPRIAVQPRSRRSGVGDTVTFTVDAAGSPPLTFAWSKDNLPLTDGGRVSGSRTAALTLTGVQFGDTGVYTVRVSNAQGIADSDPATLLVVADGANISGQISYDGAQSGPTLVTAAQRRVGNQVLQLDGSGYAITPITDLSGPELTVQYWFRGSVSQSAVRQQSDGWIVSTWNGLHILSNDGGVGGIDAGQALTDGQWHHVALTWKQGAPGGFASYLDGKLVAQRDAANVPIPNRNAPLYFGAVKGDGFFVTAFMDLNGNGVQDPNEPSGAYLNNPLDLVNDRTGVDIVLYDPPVIVAQPNSIAVAAGSTVTFNVGATGSAPLSYQWRKDGVDLTDGGGVAGAQTATLTLTGVTAANEGTYRLVVSNPAASVASAGAFLVLAASITDGLVGHWQFDETSGLTAANSAVGGAVAADGELINYVGDDSHWVAGQIGGALDFGGPDLQEWVWVSDYPKPDRVMSCSAWVWAESLPTWASVAKNWGQATTGQFHFGITDSSGDLSNYITQSGGGTVSARTQQPFPIGTWVHVAFVCDGASLRLYQNGVQVAAAAYDGSLIAPPAMHSLAIGVKTGDDGVTPDSGYWDGRIDDLGLWLRPLTPDEIRGIYTAGLAGLDLTQATATPSDVRLSISYDTGSVTLSWPATAAGWTLQQSAVLHGTSWQRVPEVTGTSVTVPVTNELRFYRLMQ